MRAMPSRWWGRRVLPSLPARSTFQPASEHDRDCLHRDEQPARVATLSVGFSPVTLAPPKAQGQPTDARGVDRRSPRAATAQRSHPHPVAAGDDAAGNLCRGSPGKSGVLCAALADRIAPQSAQERVSDRTATVGNRRPLGAGSLGVNEVRFHCAKRPTDSKPTTCEEKCGSQTPRS